MAPHLLMLLLLSAAADLAHLQWPHQGSQTPQYPSPWSGLRSTHKERAQRDPGETVKVPPTTLDTVS
jgi:hypothetical protein